jgi:adenylate kinase
MIRIALIAPPGAGKGTQGRLLAERLDIPHVSTGDVLRDHVGRGTEVGRAAREVMDTGGLVGDELMMELLETALVSAGDGIILDGFPRTAKQAELLAGRLSRDGLTIEVALRFVARRDAVRDRMLARGRDDDAAEVVDRRLAVYAAEEAALIDAFRGRVVEVDAEGSVPEVSDRVLDGIREQLAQA